MIHMPKSFRSLSSKLHLQELVGILFTLTLLLGAFLLLHGCEQKSKLSPEHQAVQDMYDRIQEEMTEEQVDAILTGHESTTTKEAQDSDYGVTFKRKSAYRKTFSKSGAQEGDYFLYVYFDNDGYVVGKNITSILK